MMCCQKMWDVLCRPKGASVRVAVVGGACEGSELAKPPKEEFVASNSAPTRSNEVPCRRGSHKNLLERRCKQP